MNPPKVFTKAGIALKKASPTILTCIGAIGVVATAVLAVKATPKALEAIQEDSRKNHDGDPDAATKLEAVKSGWKFYIPAVATGTASLVCIFGANVLNRKQQASLASAYALLNRSYNDYRRKLRELYGQEADNKVVEALAVEQSDPPHISAETLMEPASLEFEGAKEEEYLFYDVFSKRYFQATIGQVLQAEYHINRNLALGGVVGVNDFYEFLGIEPLKELSGYAWWVMDEFYWIDFNHLKTKVDDGLNGEVDCYILDMMWVPSDKEPD